MFDSPTNTNTQRLIATIYAATVPSEDFSTLVDDLHAHVGEVIGGILNLKEPYASLPNGTNEIEASHIASFEAHIKTALSIQAELGFSASQLSKMNLALGLIPAAAIVVDIWGNVLDFNDSALERFGSTHSLLEVFSGQEDFASIMNAISKLKPGNTFSAVPLQTEKADRFETCVIIRRFESGNGSPQEVYFLLTFSDLAFDDNVAHLLRATFGLTKAESQVALQLGQGLTPEAIAKSRSVSLQTIRGQIKSIKNKMQIKTLTQMVRTICGFSVGAARFEEPISPSVASRKAETSWIETITLRDGRRLDCLVQGAASGRDILLFHNLPYGARLPQGVLSRATKKGVRFLAPFRPGYGDSDCPGNLVGKEYLELVSDDTQEVLSHFELSSVPLLAQAGGSSFGMYFAGKYPNSCSALTFTNWAPSWKPHWLSRLTPRHRVLSVLMKTSPSLAKLFVGSMLSYINKRDATKFLRDACIFSPPDLELTNQPEMTGLIANDIRTALKNGVDPYLREWWLLEEDMTDIARRLEVPINLICGSEDRITPPDLMECFCEEVPSTNLSIIEGAGHYLFYSHWQQWMTVIEQQCDAATEHALSR